MRFQLKMWNSNLRKTALCLQESPRRRSTGNMPYTDTLDGDDDSFGDTIQDTLTLRDSAQLRDELREDAKFHEMSR